MEKVIAEIREVKLKGVWKCKNNLHKNEMGGEGDGMSE